MGKLLEERKESAMELNRLEEKVASLKDTDEMKPPAAKQPKKYYYHNNEEKEPDDEESVLQLENKIERLKEEIECKSNQINEIQQMVLDGDQGRK